MPQLDSGGLMTFHDRTPKQTKREPVTRYNGREVDEKDRDIITQAMEEAREREASMIRGLVR